MGVVASVGRLIPRLLEVARASGWGRPVSLGRKVQAREPTDVRRPGACRRYPVGYGLRVKTTSMFTIFTLACALACNSDDGDPVAPMDPPDMPTEPAPDPEPEPGDGDGDACGGFGDSCDVDQDCCEGLACAADGICGLPEGDGDGDGDGEPPDRADNFEADYVAIIPGDNFGELVELSVLDSKGSIVAELSLTTTFVVDDIDQQLNGTVDFAQGLAATHREKAEKLAAQTVTIGDSGWPLKDDVFAERLAKIRANLEPGSLETDCVKALLAWLAPDAGPARVAACECGAWWNTNHPGNPLPNMVSNCDW